MAQRTFWLSWEAPAPPNPDVNAYAIYRQDAAESAAWEVVAMTRGYTGAVVSLPRCVKARFAVHEMKIDADPMRYHDRLPDATVREREPGPWRVWCGYPDFNEDGTVSIGDLMRFQNALGSRLVGDEWVR